MKFFRISLDLISLLICITLVEGTVIDNLSSMTWDGIAMYIPVDRNFVQQKLDEYHLSLVDQCNRPELLLPDTPVFPDFLNTSQHVLYISIGNSVSLDFEDPGDPCLSTRGTEMSVAIPFLSTRSSVAPHYSLALAKMYDRRRGYIAKPNIAFPYIPIDEVTMGDDFALLRNGSDEFRLSLARYTDPCIPAARLVRQEIEEFSEHEMQIGATEPNFDICDSHPQENKFCSIVKEIRCDVSRVAPNFCQLPWKSGDIVSCKATISVSNVTSGFRNFMLLNDSPVNVIDSGSFSGHFPIGIKYPCIV